MMTALPIDLEMALRACSALSAGETVLVAELLAGGVSSDIWKIGTDTQTLCAKRALPRLKVDEVWEAPTERNRYEARWYRTASQIVPGAAPSVIASDDDLGVFAMEYFDPALYALWKKELSIGRVDVGRAAQVGALLASIHSGTARRSDLAAEFDTIHLFEALRLSPYLRFTGTRHPDLADRLNALADDAAATHTALVHGDVSPKNILLGPDRAVILDAECAWYGDPAFDPAFCLNHLLLKSVWVPASHADFQASFAAFWAAYLAGVDWEDCTKLAARVAAYLGALMLARIDGKSPVEYITEEADKARVRKFARERVIMPAADPLEVAANWNAEQPNDA